MGYFSNSTDGAAFEHQCSRCKMNDASCPIAAVQFNYNYDAVNNKVATEILNGLVKDNGLCLMYLEIEKAWEGNQKPSTASKCNKHIVNGWLLYEFPENLNLYKTDGRWQLRSDNGKEIIIDQNMNESDTEFIERCKACR